MSVMLPFLSWFLLLVMVAGGGFPTSSSTTEVMITSNSAAVAAYWRTMLPNTVMPSAILELLTPPADDIANKNYRWRGPPIEGNVEKDNFKWGGPPTKGEVKKDNFKWGGPHIEGNIEKDNFKWGGPPTKAEVEKDNFKWGGPPTEDDVEKDNFKWGAQLTKDKVEKDNFKWGGRPPKDDVKKDNFKWGGPPTKDDVEKDNFKWGALPAKEDIQKDNFKWGRAPTKDNLEKDNFIWGVPSTKDNVKTDNFKWGPSTTEIGGSHHIEKDNFKWGCSPTKDDCDKDNFKWKRPPTEANVEKDNFKWGGPVTKYDIEKDNFQWGGTKDDVKKDNFKWGGAKDDVEKDNFKWGPPTTEIGESHIGQHSHKHGTMPNNVFLEDDLKPGSAITCYVLPSHNSGAPLLQRDVADTIPMSKRYFTDIMRMFAPVSNGMADGIWSTLENCEHPEPIKGEMKACATSVESMVEFAASVLGVSTYNLRAFSSPDVPTGGIMPGRGYRVAASTRVTEAGDTMTCHGGRFPFAMFMCHAVNPTRVYSVILEGEDVFGEGSAPQPIRMEALVVCHLDTSAFDPARMPLHVKPGDAPLCHFLSRDSIIWAPDAPASGQAAA